MPLEFGWHTDRWRWILNQFSATSFFSAVLESKFSVLYQLVATKWHTNCDFINFFETVELLILTKFAAKMMPKIWDWIIAHKVYSFNICSHSLYCVLSYISRVKKCWCFCLFWPEKYIFKQKLTIFSLLFLSISKCRHYSMQTL